MDDIVNCETKSKQLFKNVSHVMNNLEAKITGLGEDISDKEMHLKKQFDFTNDVSDSIDYSKICHKSTEMRHCSTPKSCLKIPMQNTNSVQLKKSLNKNLDEELWSIDSRPNTFATSHGTNDCDFQFVETFLPKNIEATSNKLLTFDDEDDDLSENSHSVFTITKLVSNLNLQKTKNKTLQERIEYLENEMQIANLKLELHDSNNCDPNSGSLSAHVEEIHNAQREQEAAVLGRLKLANRERDEALLTAKASIKTDSYNGYPSDTHLPENMNELLDLLSAASTGRAIEKYGRKILDFIVKIKQEKSRITNEEMSTVISEKNDALHKMFQSNLAQSTDSIDHIKLLNNKLRSAADDAELFRIYYSLYKSLQVDGGCSDDSQRLVEALRVSQEHARVQESRYKRYKEEIKVLSEENSRLQRLVAVLRNKLLAPNSST